MRGTLNTHYHWPTLPAGSHLILASPAHAPVLPLLVSLRHTCAATSVISEQREDEGLHARSIHLCTLECALSGQSESSLFSATARAPHHTRRNLARRMNKCIQNRITFQTFIVCRLHLVQASQRYMPYRLPPSGYSSPDLAVIDRRRIDDRRSAGSKIRGPSCMRFVASRWESTSAGRCPSTVYGV